MGAKVPIVVYVAPPGARAASAGVFITMAAHVAAMAPGTNIGAAHPVQMGEGEMSKELGEKVTNDAVAMIRSIAEKRGRSAWWAERAVRESVSIPETEAVGDTVVDLIAPGLDSLLAAVDGRVVEVSSGRVALDTRGAEISRIRTGLRFRVLDIISNPNIAYILLILGFYGLFFELSNPGTILPGVVGGICIILAFYALRTLPINAAGLALIVLALILFVAEVKVTSHGLLTVGGVVSMLFGSLMLIESPLPFLRISWVVIVSTVVLTVLFFLFAVTMGVRAQRRKPTTGREGLIGMVGTAHTDLTPRGVVILHGEYWQAECDEPVAHGEAVRVTSVDGLVCQVTRA
jgi:membrane-bound serine protease (ClpP class)